MLLQQSFEYLPLPYVLLLLSVLGELEPIYCGKYSKTGSNSSVKKTQVYAKPWFFITEPANSGSLRETSTSENAECDLSCLH
jgi:hypothetical protein